jgi:hypothetical protein
MTMYEVSASAVVAGDGVVIAEVRRPLWHSHSP